MAQTASGEWKKARVLDVTEKSCRVSFFEDGTEKVMSSLLMTFEAPDDNLAPLVPPKPKPQSSGERRPSATILNVNINPSPRAVQTAPLSPVRGGGQESPIYGASPRDLESPGKGGPVKQGKTEEYF